jgi:hypothetical protein
MPNEIKTLADGKISAKLETGEVFEGDPLEVTAKLAEAQVNTKRWGQEWKAKAEAPPVPPTPAIPADQNEAQLQKYLLDQTAKSLGYASGDEYKADLARVKATTEEVNNNLVAASFMAQCQDFPNSKEAIDALSAKIDENHWDFSTQSMIAAHALCLREDKYKPLSAQDQNATWEQGLRNSNRGIPPPMIRSSAPDNNNSAPEPWAMKMEDLRAAAIRQQLEQK